MELTNSEKQFNSQVFLGEDGLVDPLDTLCFCLGWLSLFLTDRLKKKKKNQEHGLFCSLVLPPLTDWRTYG